MDHMNWIWAAIALGSGLLIGEIGGRIVRSSLGRDDRRANLRAASRAAGNFVFWASTSAGLLVAIGLINDEVLQDLAARLDDDLPRFMVAVLLLLTGYALSVAIAAMVGQSARAATGVRQLGLERLLRVVIMAGATVVALTQLGVDSSVLVVMLAGLLGAPALALALLSGLGGREVASELAAGRVLRQQLKIGRTLRSGEHEGRIVALHPTTVEIEDADGARVHLPNRLLLGTAFSLLD